MKITKYIVNSIDRLPKGYVFTDEDFMGEVKRMKQSLQHSTEWLLPAKEIETSEETSEVLKRGRPVFRSLDLLNLRKSANFRLY